MSSNASSLKRVNKQRSSVRGGISQQVNVTVLVATAALIAYGSLIIWTASLSIAEASFPRHLLGIGLGLALAVLLARTDLRGLAGMSTVLLAIDILVIFSPYIPGLSYNAKGSGCPASASPSSRWSSRRLSRRSSWPGWAPSTTVASIPCESTLSSAACSPFRSARSYSRETWAADSWSLWAAW